MSSDAAKKARGHAAAAVRAQFLKPDRACGAREPIEPLPILKMLAGGEWQGWDLRTDLALRGIRFLEWHPHCTERTNRRIGDLLLGADLARVRAARAALLAEADRPKISGQDQRGCLDLADVLLLAAAEFGDAAAARQAAGLALDACLVEISRRSPTAW
ncbi:MAG: hypothetical protein MIL41_24575, partial [Hyphomicrobiales bacterium]